MTGLWPLALDVSPGTAIAATLAIAMCGVTIDAIELLYTRRCYLPDGVFSWTIRRTIVAPGHTASPTLTMRLMEPLQRYSSFVALALLQLSCVALIAAGPPPLVLPAVALIVAARLVTIVRLGPYGGEGSDQMLLIVLAATALYLLAPDTLARTAVLWFIAGECMLAYVTAGVIKLRQAKWRSGAAMRDVMSTDLFGTAMVGALFRRWPGLSVAACWAVIAFECLFPILVIASPETCAFALVSGVLMHAGIAGLQGLNVFFFAFVAAYPAIWITARQIHGAIMHLFTAG